jgi:D-tagatose-1,6-bisphosphate aldolase subunit GatZ/KbaZ
MPNHLSSLIQAQKRGEARGLSSICSAHPLVLEAALRHGLAHNTPVLIESTCNQVNQFGGYTGMTPADFVRFVGSIADSVGFPRKNLILGGDHLGPLVWSNEPADVAMDKAQTMVRDYVRAGFTKIHLDASMPCADDTSLPVELVARRAAQLAQAAEESIFPSPLGKGAGGEGSHYIIGTEVPPAGGAKAGETDLQVTSVASAAETLEVTQQAFRESGLESAWERVIALVVQPGVEFSDTSIHEYDRAAAAGLSRFIESLPGLVYEAHSTDYQTRPALRALVEDHFAILKVGPGLTFALREAVFALALMENELISPAQRSNIVTVLESAMLRDPAHWQKHYHGSPAQVAFARKYSLSDRIRYYWPDSHVQAAFEKLLANLGQKPLPLSLLSQFAPPEYAKIRAGEAQNTPKALISNRIWGVLSDYAFACSG